MLVLLESVGRVADGVTFTELRERLGDVAGATVTRVLEPLLEHRYVEKRDGRYRAGASLGSLARAVTGAASLEERLEPVVRELSVRTGHSAAYFHWDGEWAYVRIACEVGESFHYAAVGTRSHPATHTFLRPILANLPRRALRGNARGVTEEVREEIRRTGIDRQEELLRGRIYRITAPVFYGDGGKIAGSLGITSLLVRFPAAERRRIEESVREAARACSEQLANFQEK